MNDFKTDIIWTMNCTYLPGDVVEKHSHTFFHYIYVQSGNGKITIDNTTLDFIPGHIYLIEPMVFHQFSAGDKGLCAHELKFETVDTDMFHKLCGLPLSLDTNGYDIKEIFRSLFSETAAKDTYYKNMVIIKFYELITLLFRCASYRENHKSTDKKPSDKFSMVISYINKNLQSEITLQTLSGIVHMESIYFLKQFKQVTGSTPMAYVRNVRINKAKTLLLHSDMNITQISAAVGFLSIHHFSSAFKKITGMSPAAFKEHYQKEATAK